MIVDPVTVRPTQKIYEAQEIMRSFRISGVPVVDEFNKLVGISTIAICGSRRGRHSD